MLERVPEESPGPADARFDRSHAYPFDLGDLLVGQFLDFRPDEGRLLPIRQTIQTAVELGVQFIGREFLKPTGLNRPLGNRGKKQRLAFPERVDRLVLRDSV